MFYKPRTILSEEVLKFLYTLLSFSHIYFMELKFMELLVKVTLPNLKN